MRNKKNYFAKICEIKIYSQKYCSPIVSQVADRFCLFSTNFLRFSCKFSQKVFSALIQIRIRNSYDYMIWPYVLLRYLVFVKVLSIPSGDVCQPSPCHRPQSEARSYHRSRAPYAGNFCSCVGSQKLGLKGLVGETELEKSSKNCKKTLALYCFLTSL